MVTEIIRKKPGSHMTPVGGQNQACVGEALSRLKVAPRPSVKYGNKHARHLAAAVSRTSIDLSFVHSTIPHEYVHSLFNICRCTIARLSFRLCCISDTFPCKIPGFNLNAIDLFQRII